MTKNIIRRSLTFLITLIYGSMCLYGVSEGAISVDDGINLEHQIITTKTSLLYEELELSKIPSKAKNNDDINDALKIISQLETNLLTLEHQQQFKFVNGSLLIVFSSIGIFALAYSLILTLQTKKIKKHIKIKENQKNKEQ